MISRSEPAPDTVGIFDDQFLRAKMCDFLPFLILIFLTASSTLYVLLRAITGLYGDPGLYPLSSCDEVWRLGSGGNELLRKNGWVTMDDPDGAMIRWEELH